VGLGASTVAIDIDVRYGTGWQAVSPEVMGLLLQTAMNDLKSGMEAFSETAASSLADAIVNGEDLSEVFKNLAKQLASMLLQALVLKPLMSALTGTGGGIGAFGFSAVPGGGVPPNAAYMAGLRGLSANPYAGLSNFAGRTAANDPSQQITQNNKTEIHVDTGSGDSKVTATQGVAFARQLDAAVQKVLVREQRPGGTLYKRSA
jgi:hypothetical protein